jgi:hypothetical protein
MIPLKRLCLVAGFDGQDFDARISSLQKHYQAGDRKFVGRLYPGNAEKRASYLKNLVQAANKIIFGDDGAFNFCRKQDQLCAIAHTTGRNNQKRCDRKHQQFVACGRARPKLVVVLCASRIYEEVFFRLGRGALLIRLENERLPDEADVIDLLEKFEPSAQDVVNEINNRVKSLYAPLIPLMNFQNPTGMSIAKDVQENPGSFASIMLKYHKILYNGAFRNPVKKNVAGAYMFDADIAFQQDPLHNTTQTIGKRSHSDGFHLLNAYHVYGVPTDPGFHFDVMNVKGKPISQVFEDILTGAKSDPGDSHINITPCDRQI